MGEAAVEMAARLSSGTLRDDTRWRPEALKNKKDAKPSTKSREAEVVGRGAGEVGVALVAGARTGAAEETVGAGVWVEGTAAITARVGI